MAKIELNYESPQPPKPTLVETLNADHCPIEFYVHNPKSTAPMMYDFYSSRDEADEAADKIPGATVLFREIGEWQVAP